MLRSIIHHLRWPNLLILALIQSLVYYKLIQPAHSILSWWDVLWIILITALIGAAGYVINDYYDESIDRVNRPSAFESNLRMDRNRLMKVYIFLVGTGALLALSLGWKLGLWKWWWIYAVATAALWLYSGRLKCSVLAGNLLVSAFGGGVVMIMIVPDALHRGLTGLQWNVLYYTAFAFLSTWYREVVKDLEDLQGDQREQCETFVVRYGISAAKKLALVPVLLLVLTMILWFFHLDTLNMLLPLTVLQLFILSSLVLVMRANDRESFGRCSSMIKLVMIGGTILLFFI